VRSFKSAVTKAVNERRGTPGDALWRRNYYERIIRSEAELQRIREYIANNPALWQYDTENPARTASAEYGRAWSWIEHP
jgi:REP element-mobilizing transposase RayT